LACGGASSVDGQLVSVRAGARLAKWAGSAMQTTTSCPSAEKRVDSRTGECGADGSSLPALSGGSLGVASLPPATDAISLLLDAESATMADAGALLAAAGERASTSIEDRSAICAIPSSSPPCDARAGSACNRTVKPPLLLDAGLASSSSAAGASTSSGAACRFACGRSMVSSSPRADRPPSGQLNPPYESRGEPRQEDRPGLAAGAGP